MNDHKYIVIGLRALAPIAFVVAAILLKDTGLSKWCITAGVLVAIFGG